MKVILNEPNNSTLAVKAKLFVEKYPTLQKTSKYILNCMKLISFRVVKTTKRKFENSTNNRAIKKTRQIIQKRPLFLYTMILCLILWYIHVKD